MFAVTENFAHRFPHLAEGVSEFEALPTEKARSGDATVMVDGKYVHSKFDPRKEADRFVENCQLNAPCLVTFGLGLGYFQAAMIKRIPPEVRLVIFEKDPRMVKTALESGVLNELMAHSNLELLTSIPDDFAVTEAAMIETPAAAIDRAHYASLQTELVVRTRKRSSVHLPQRAKIFANIMNGLGDLILVAPTLRALKLALDAEITVLCWHNLIDLAQAYPFLDRFIVFGDKYRTDNGIPLLLADVAASGPYDLALDFAFPPLSAAVSQATQAPLKISIRPSEQYSVGINVIGRKAHWGIMDETFNILDALNIPRPAEWRAPDLFLKGEDFKTADAILEDIGPREKLVLIHPGAGVAARRWSTEKFAHLADEIAERYGATVLFLGGRAAQMSVISIKENATKEEDAVAAILKKARRRHHSAAGRDNTRVLALLLEQCDLFIGNNSGPAHLSGQLGRRTLALWGPSDPREWSPVGPEVEIAINVAGLERGAGGAECYPCSPQGCDRPVCMEQLSVKDALDAIERRWPGLPPARKRSSRAYEIGAGERPEEGYLHLDQRPLRDIEVVADVVNLPLAKGSARQLRAQHIIEHFPMNDCAGIVRRWIESVEIGGAVEVVTPNLGYIAFGYASGTLSTQEAVLRLYGEQNYPGNFHFNLFDRNSLRKLMMEAGCDPVYDITRRYESRVHPMSLYMVGYRKT